MKFLLTFSCVLLTFLFANAQFNFGASNANTMALGNTATTQQNVFSVIDNQAGLAGVDNILIGVTSNNSFLIEGLYTFTAVTGIPTKSGNFGAGLQYKGYEGYNELKATIAYGRKLFENLNIGASINAYNLNITNYGNTMVINATIGLQAQLSKQLLLGAHISNPVKINLTEDEQSVLPTTLTAGLRYKPSSKASVYVEGEKSISNTAIFKGGLAYQIINNFELMIGAASSVDSFTAGLNWQMKSLQIAFAGSYHTVLGFSPALSLSYGVGGNRYEVESDR